MVIQSEHLKLLRCSDLFLKFNHNLLPYVNNEMLLKANLQNCKVNAQCLLLLMPI